MFLSGGNKEHVSRRKCGFVLTLYKKSCPSHDHVNFILIVRLLRIGAARRIQFHSQCAVAEYLDPTIFLLPRQFIDRAEKFAVSVRDISFNFHAPHACGN